MPASILAGPLVALACTVIHVADGDTLTARCQPDPSIRLRVRLAQVDAPEDGQAFGRVSKRNLIDLCLDADAQITPRDVDQYGRVVATVVCRGQDAGREQVRAGLAWVYRHYATDSSLYDIERAARHERLGLWADPAPMPPWRWRMEPHETP